MFAMWFSLYILGTLFIEWIPLPFFLKLQPFRCTDIFLLLFFPWFAREIFRGFSKSLTCRILHSGLFLLMLFFNLKTYPSILKDTLTLCWLILVFAKIRQEEFPERKNRITEQRFFQALTWGSVLYVVFLMVTVNHWTAAWGLARVILGQDRFWFWTMGAFFIIGSYLVILLKIPYSNLPVLSLKRITLYLVILLGIELLQIIVGTVTTELRREGHFFYSRYHPLFFEAARWCRDHTPKDSLFIIPPYRGGFRGESLRSVFVSWDEQVALMIAPDLYPGV